MRTKVATCLLLCVLAAGLVSATTLESNRLPSFLEFVANVPAHEATAPPKTKKQLLALITPSKTLKPRAYIKGYLSLSPSVKKQITKKYKQILRDLKKFKTKKTAKTGGKKAAPKTGVKPPSKPANKPGQKILNASNAPKTNAQKGATKKAAKKNWRVLTKDEKAKVKAGIAKRNADRKAKRAAKPAKKTKPAKKGKAPKKKVSRAAKVAAWNKLTSDQKVQWYIRAHFRARRNLARVQKGVLGWKKVSPAKKKALKKKYSVKQKKIGKNTGKKPAKKSDKKVKKSGAAAKSATVAPPKTPESK